MECNSTTPILASFDVETYISRYHVESETRLQRLLFIAKNSPSVEMSKLAYELAERQMKSVGNTKRYKETFGPNARHFQNHQQTNTNGAAASSTAPPNHPTATAQQHPLPPPCSITYSDEWTVKTDQLAQNQIEMLEARLSSAQSHLAKDAIRAAYASLADFYKRRGELRDAMRCLLRSREFCTTNKQIALVCLEVIEVGIDGGNYAHVNAYVTKAEHTADLLSSGPPLTSAKLRCASGLSYLNEGRYVLAAHKLAGVSFDLQFDRVISAEDIALYASLLGLASLGRDSLRRLILDNQNFQQRLELVPRMRDALRHFSRAEYGPCLDLLNALKPELRLDIHLSAHVDTLYKKVFDRCIITYFYPYKSVCLKKMGKAFNMDTEQMEQVLENLILDQRIKGARINATDAILTTENGFNHTLVKRVLKCGHQFMDQTESMILRLSCLEQDLVVKPDVARGSYAMGRYARHRRDALEGSRSDDDSETHPEEEDVMMMDVEPGHEYDGNMWM